MKIKLLRIDSRLIHGQIANNWVGTVGVQTMIAACDSAAHDNLRKTLLMQVGREPTKTFVLDIAKTLRVYNNPKYADLDVLMVVETPQDVIRLMDGGIPVTEVNVGGITYKEGMTRVTESVSVGKAEIEAFQELHRRGIKLEVRQLPSSSHSDMMDDLKAKNLI
ncbi:MULTISPECIES: PTS system mannose/fructose/N-acetylgalactosamine-transporter subunit IIB [Bifidobacterium]|jgi:PTS system mannose-specific IIB component|uniref:PTS fructose transporter subunit IIB n=1 Tax=Bifidobacterium tibiigranuli TaxID=2172043 RepID=A0A5N6S1D6_9BIFI|nr:PTS sugar transporter subunit IIB [Bifidobacterium tibiigranuli]KAE8127243.1 PTS fructose transporter subunit IIB [Bifidobacterium tibiigranuli]KAE8129634.1 PTS fructose transporter subunit IIB [Bifidobacterium tibiigranuli]MCH3975638.1 PTS sugar transporter subunit IIB [Bifidobacterium tibiigranuli]MCH4189593.1 PTS sugar transporter subunit IIB [Bifidobacterium tibiigranuli]MCH4204428.1 PTS sugar transporter subunit IIB [Bifidobacterium tibiigranuli]